LKPLLSITTFNIDRYTTIENFLNEYREIGLDTLELNGRVRQHVIDALFPYLYKGEIKISSLHNYCPRPEIMDNGELQLSSLDEETRSLAVRYTCNTIEMAHRVGAKAVVIHMGEVEGLKTLMDMLKDLYRCGEKDSLEFIALKSRLMEQRRKNKAAYVKACEKSFIELSDFIARRNYSIKLGLENRYYHGEIPLVEEYDIWFEQYSQLPIYLWYDFGHGEVQHNLTLIDKYEILERHGERLLGLHIHDCIGIDDHRVPGTGEIDFEFVKKYLRPDVLRVLEYGYGVQPVSKIAEGVEYLKQKGMVK